jgi:hypothetical protein
MPGWRLLVIIALLLLGGCSHPAANPITASPNLAPTPSPFVSPTGPAGSNEEPRVTIIEWSGDTLVALCELEANRKRASAPSGELVEIVSRIENGIETCLLRPVNGKEGTAALITWLSRPDPGGNAAIIRAGTEQAAFDAFTQLNADSEPQVTPIPCEFNQGEITSSQQSLGPLIIYEYPLAHSARCSPLYQPQSFYERVHQGLPGMPEDDLSRLATGNVRLDQMNEQLKPFGYSIESYGDGILRIMKDGSLLRANISWMGQLTTSADGSRFLLPVLDSYNSASFLLRETGIEAPAGSDLLVYDNIYPVISSKGEVKLEYDTQAIPRPPADPALLNVFIDGKLADRIFITGSTSAGGPVRGLWSTQDGYLIEANGMVLKNNEILNDRFDCDEIFGWQIISGEEFFFCQRKGEVRAYINEQPTTLVFDEVIRGPLPGSSMLVQMRRSYNASAFFARRGDDWLYVIIREEKI